MKKSKVPELFIQFLWQQLCFDLQDLKTTEGVSVRLEKTGYGNSNSGPDFLNARIWIGETLWAGQVEIHVFASEWYAHNHQEDPAYDNVILHVVLTEDRPVMSRIGYRIPCLELKNRIPKDALRMYHRWMNSRRWIACEPRFSELPPLDLKLWLDRVLAERLEAKVQAMAALLEKYRGNWEQLFRTSLFRGFGLKVNAEPMEMLAESIPYGILDKYKNRRSELEAILFGQAGLIPEKPTDTYTTDLLKSYRFLVHKHQLKSIPGLVWKFSRLRPAAFPEIRIARLAAMLEQRSHWMRSVLELTNPSGFYDFVQVRLSPYWQKHYRFDTFSEKQGNRAGKEVMNVLLLNVVIPFLFIYGRKTGQEAYVNKALYWLEQLPAENNRLIRSWSKLVQVNTAGEGQALIHLWKNYCKNKRCLECRVGQFLIGNQSRRSWLSERNKTGKE